ncbi:fibronectin type III domain-containing protein, partial [Asanoa siamensis]|uniref:fibronectin type III domain-containing protein n=1 Tax=Asanoa siamensis TaxID=926357 RepID=UPI001942F21A
TATTLAAVLHRVGAHERAARLYHDVILELSAAEGPESARVLAAHADLATVEYARGDCATARTRLEDAWELHREVYGDGHPAGIRMLAKLGAMERDCGRRADSQAHLALAQELCRTHLPADHPLVAQVAALARAPANPDHACVVEDSELVATDSGPPPPRASGDAAGAGYVRPFTPVPEHIPPVAPTPMTAPPVAPTPVTPPPVAPAPVTPTLRDGFGSGSALDDLEARGGPRHAASDEGRDLYADGSDLRDAYAAEVYPPEAEAPPEAWSPPTQRSAPERPLWPAGAAGPSAGWAGRASDEDRSEWAREREPTGDEVWRRQDEATWDRTTSETWDGTGTDDWDSAATGREAQPPEADTGRDTTQEADKGWEDQPGAEGDEAWSGRVRGDERWAAPAGPMLPDDDWERDAWGPDPGAASLPGGPAAPAAAASARPRELEAGEEAERRAARLPERRPPGALPVRVAPPPREPRRRVAPLVIAGILVVVLGAAAVIAGFALVDRQGNGGPVTQPTVPLPTARATTAPPTTTAPPVARPGTPPGDVALDDGSDEVTLRWTYPAGAAGPVVVSAGPRGQQPRQIEQLPSGADNYVVYGLDSGDDYCFVVGVVYPAGVVGRAKPVCTDRG